MFICYIPDLEKALDLMSSPAYPVTTSKLILKISSHQSLAVNPREPWHSLMF